MKRTKFIAGALVLSMGLLGTGYAYWTDTLSVNATVSTGNLEVNFVKTSDPTYQYGSKYDANGNVLETQMDAHWGNWGAKPTLDINSEESGAQTMNLTLGNIHPGTQAVYSYSVTNSSTIPVSLVFDELKGEQSEEFNCINVKILRDNQMPIEGIGSTLEEKLRSAFQQAYSALEPISQGTEASTIESKLVLSVPAKGDKLPENINVKNIEFTMNWEQYNAR